MEHYSRLRLAHDSHGTLCSHKHRDRATASSPRDDSELRWMLEQLTRVGCGYLEAGELECVAVNRLPNSTDGVLLVSDGQRRFVASPQMVRNALVGLPDMSGPRLLWRALEQSLERYMESEGLFA